MTDEELKRLGEEAIACHERKQFDRELELWIKISAAQPDMPLWRHNVALALMNCNRLPEAFEAFNKLINSNPDLSRVHNNFAVLLIRMGVDAQHLVPAFVKALETSRDIGEFTRHFYNICVSVSFGLEDDASDVLDTLESTYPELLEKISPADLLDKNKGTLLKLLDAYRKIAAYRKSFAQRKWNVAERELEEAKTKLIEAGFSNPVAGLNNVSNCHNLCRRTIEIVERIGSDPDWHPEAALEICRHLLKEAVSLRQTYPENAMRAILDILGWFLTGMCEHLHFLQDPTTRPVPDNETCSALAEVSAFSFREIGYDLLATLQFVHKQCSYLKREVETVANAGAVATIRQSIWTKIALFCNGLSFNFQQVDLAIARNFLGWSQDALENATKELQQFKALVERQTFKDIFVADKPQENIARALLQTHLQSRSYREVLVRGGKTDLLGFSKNGRFLYETKIWRGPEYHEQGLREIEEYVAGEGDDCELMGTFYLVFDPTKTKKALDYLGAEISTRAIADGRTVTILCIHIAPPQPSKKVGGG